MTSKSLVVIAFALAGCATANPTYTPEGKPGFSISCNGSANSWATCYEKAGEVCGSRGYAILDRAGDQTPFAVANGQTLAAGGIVRRTMLISCRD